MTYFATKKTIKCITLTVESILQKKTGHCALQRLEINYATSPLAYQRKLTTYQLQRQYYPPFTFKLMNFLLLFVMDLITSAKPMNEVIPTTIASH